MPRLRLLLAGAGAFGLEHLRRLMSRADVDVAGVADPNLSALETVRERFQIERHFADPFEMVETVDAEGIVIATPAASHVPIAEHALARGLGVLLEKPVAIDAAQAEELMKAAGFVLPGHVLRFSRDHVRAMEIARSGEIGRVLYVNSRRYRDDSHAVRYADIDPVLMTLIHDIDLALWAARSPFASVEAWRSEGQGFRNITAASAVTKSGVRCDLRTAWTFGGEPPPDRLEVVGDQGSIEFEAGAGIRIRAPRGHRQIPALEGDDALENEQDHFMSCLRDSTVQPRLGLAEAVEGLRLADAILESLRMGKAVRLRP